MTLRTAGLIAGVLGVILVAMGLVANAVKPADVATPTAQVETTVVVVPPEVLAISPDAEFSITGDGHLAAHTARTEDVDAWIASRESVTLTGILDWDTLSTTVADKAPTASSSASPSPSASPSASTSASPAAKASDAATATSASPSPSASGSASASPTPSVAPSPLGSQDVWRETAQQDQTYTIAATDVPMGLTLVVEALDGSTISSASLSMPRTIDDDWISQVLWWGVGLSVVGLIALIALFVDVRPAQLKGEEWLASRSAVGNGTAEAKPGSRRARRHAGSAMPVATIPAEVTTGSIPVVIEEDTSSSEVPMVAITGPVPTVSHAAPEPPAQTFQPPQPPEPTEDTAPDQPTDEEDRS